MKVLIVGSGGREHAMGWKIAQSKKLKELYFAPGNAGTSQIGVNVSVDVDDFEGLKSFSLKNEIDLILIGPEVPLVKGVYDFFKNDAALKHIKMIAPSAEGSKLEGSKDYAKAFMMRHAIPTARYQTFTSETYAQACDFIDTLKPPFVLKADGLAAGKGVLILDDALEAKMELKKILIENKFGAAGGKVVIEEFLKGTELSVFVLTDGKSYQILPSAKDYKRIGVGDTGLNTGGMGSISPVPFVGKSFMKKVEERIIIPTIDGLKKEKIKYNGFVFIGLMNVKGNPFVIEYNVRMGDPETETVMMRIKNDFLDVLEKAADGKLNTLKIRHDSRFASCVMIVSGGYPEAFQKGKLIKGLEKVNKSNVFHAGTSLDASGNVLSNGGRVLAVSSYGKKLKDALDTTFESVRQIEFEQMYYRKDIGNDLLSRY